MQQLLIQQMFQGADTNGDGTISKTEFENFYNQFMGANPTSRASASTTAAADQLYQQLNTTGNGLTLSQFAIAVKLMMSQRAQGHHHHHQGTGASGTANSSTLSPSATGPASNNPTTWLQTMLAAGNPNAPGQSAPVQNNGGIEYTA
jgi:hypothetical protein